MSTEKYHIRVLWIAMVALIATATGFADDSYGGDPVLEFYCTQAASVSAESDALRNGVSFSLLTTSHYKRVASNGRITSVDTAIVRYWFSSGSLDSQVVETATSDGIMHQRFSVPDVFNAQYRYTFYPNDTGGELLAIGFDTPTVDDSLPAGLVVIDRDSYSLCRLYLYYPHREGYKRFSRCYRMSEHDGFLFPDSIWEVGAREGVFSTENYRLETRIDAVSVDRP